MNRLSNIRGNMRRSYDGYVERFKTLSARFKALEDMNVKDNNYLFNAYSALISEQIELLEDIANSNLIDANGKFIGIAHRYASRKLGYNYNSFSYKLSRMLLYINENLVSLVERNDRVANIVYSVFKAKNAKYMKMLSEFYGKITGRYIDLITYCNEITDGMIEIVNGLDNVAQESRLTISNSNEVVEMI